MNRSVRFPFVRFTLGIGALALSFLETPSTWAEGQETLVVYSGRSNSLVAPLVERFEQETGVKVEVRYGGTSQLALTIDQEGERSPADLFWAQDTGALETLEKKDLFARLPPDLFAPILEPFKDMEQAWAATSARARTLAYAPARVKPEDLPRSVFDLTDPQWKGRVGWAPSNASFQAFVSAMRSKAGEDRTREWLLRMKANEAKVYPKNSPILEALAAGEIDLGLPNHYYLIQMKKERPNLAVEQTAFDDGDLGNLVFVAGAGILKSSKKMDLAEKFLRFLLSDASQRFFTDDVSEYPVTGSVAPTSRLLDPAALSAAAPKVGFDEMEDLEGTVKLLREVGLL